MKLDEFKKEHKEFLDMLTDDTWLCDEPIQVEEVVACWKWAVALGVESVSSNDFEDKFGLSFKHLADWWNKEILNFKNYDQRKT